MPVTKAHKNFNIIMTIISMDIGLMGRKDT